MLTPVIDYTLVESGQAIITDAYSNPPALAALDLGADIAITCFNPASKRIGIARAVDNETLKAFLTDMAESEYTNPFPVCEVRVIGGVPEMDSDRYLLDFVTLLASVDRDRDVIDLVSSAIGGTPHPQSFRITAFDGKIGEI